MKQEFINSYNLTQKKILTKVFRVSENTEKQFGMDFCCLPEDALFPILDKTTGLARNTTQITLRILREYVNHCEKLGYKVSHGIYSYEPDYAARYKGQLVQSPHHLQAMMTQSLQRPELETIDCILQGYLWMLYAAMLDEETIQIQTQHVCLRDLTIRYDGKAFKIYDEAKFVFLVLLKNTQFYSMRYQKYYDRAPGDHILRGRGTEIPSLSKIKTQLSKKYTQTDNPYLKPSNVYLSGVFYICYQLEISGYPINISEIVSRNKKGRYKVSGDLQDYEIWKQAFELT